MDTIFALATAQGKAGVAIIRISGPQAFIAAKILCHSVPPNQSPKLKTLVDENGLVLDRALVLSFSGPKSFTGEDTVEFHLHGSTAVISIVLKTLGSGVARLAEPGEFTRRALDNNKLDLAQVEGLADLIEAETEVQRRQALRGMVGDLGKHIEEWRKKLIRSAALIEATIDFSDEDVPVDVSVEVIQLLGEVEAGLSLQLKGFSVAERIRTGFEVAIIGSPNTGKSTLLNALACREAAITSEYAGTTRDIIEVRMDLNGVPVTLLDTAGLRQAMDEIEIIGINRAISRAKQADLRIFLKEPDELLPLLALPDDIILAPKADLRNDDLPSVSGITGEGLSNLTAEISEKLKSRIALAGLVTHERHNTAIKESLIKLVAAKQHIGLGPDHYDITAEEIRSAVRCLEVIIGRVDVENLLDEIFSSFCLGK